MFVLFYPLINWGEKILTRGQVEGAVRVSDASLQVSRVIPIFVGGEHSLIDFDKFIYFSIYWLFYTAFSIIHGYVV